MAELSTLARPYAKAAFEFAVEREGLQEWAEALALLAVVAEQDKVARLLHSPNLTAEQKADSLLQVCGDEVSGKAVSNKIENFTRLLAENQRLGLLSQIQQQFQALKADREKAIDVELISASSIDDAQQQKLATALTARLQREVNITVSVDSELIGGAVVRAGDMVIDGSVRGRLNKLAEALNS